MYRIPAVQGAGERRIILKLWVLGVQSCVPMNLDVYVHFVRLYAVARRSGAVVSVYLLQTHHEVLPPARLLTERFGAPFWHGS